VLALLTRRLTGPQRLPVADPGPVAVGLPSPYLPDRLAAAAELLRCESLSLMALEHDDLRDLITGESPWPTRPVRGLNLLAVEINREKAA
jgi:hypothetical protein